MAEKEYAPSQFDPPATVCAGELEDSSLKISIGDESLNPVQNGTPLGI
jgi:hypothetical protein